MPNTREMVDLSGTREYKILEPGICRETGVCCRVRAPLLAQMCMLHAECLILRTTSCDENRWDSHCSRYSCMLNTMFGSIYLGTTGQQRCDKET